jgi:hypothetical protein
MADKRPFAVDQAEGLRRMFAAGMKKAFVVGFIAASREARVGAAMELMAVRLRNAGSTVLLVDEQARPDLHGPAVLHRPSGLGAHIDEYRHQYDYVFVNAYPSRESFIHAADLFAVTAPAPEFDREQIRLLLKAISGARQEIALVLTSTGENHSALTARQAIEDIADRNFKRVLQWLGSIPVDRHGNDIAASVDSCIERLERIRINKEQS